MVFVSSLINGRKIVLGIAFHRLRHFVAGHQPRRSGRK
jgi:hypothetical protein